MFSGDSLPDPMLISPNDNIVEMSTGGDDLLSRALEDIFNQTEDQEEEGGGQGQETITLNGGQGQVEVVLAGGGQQEEGDVDDPEEDGEQEEQGDNSKTVFPHCEICGKEFASKKNLRLHLAEIHQGKRGEFTCGDCGNKYTRLRSLERHQNKHHLGDIPQCRICRKRVVNPDLHYKKFHCKSKSVQVGGRKAKRRRKAE